MSGKTRPPNDPSPPFFKKEKGGEGRSKAWWPMEGSKLGGQWNVPSLVANGRFHAWWPMECEGKTHFHLFPLSPQQTLLKLSIFFFDLMVLLYHGSRPLLPSFFLFLRSINYDYALQCNKSFTPSLSI